MHITICFLALGEPLIAKTRGGAIEVVKVFWDKRKMRENFPNFVQK